MFRERRVCCIIWALLIAVTVSLSVVCYRFLRLDCIYGLSALLPDSLDVPFRLIEMV